MYVFSATPRISALSTRYIRCAVSATDNGELIDPTDESVDFAFVDAGDTPVTADWVSGSWETTSEEYLARCLVGDGGAIELAAGTYDVWVRVILLPETIAEPVGELTIY